MDTITAAFFAKENGTLEAFLSEHEDEREVIQSALDRGTLIGAQQDTKGFAYFDENKVLLADTRPLYN